MKTTTLGNISMNKLVGGGGTAVVNDRVLHNDVLALGWKGFWRKFAAESLAFGGNGIDRIANPGGNHRLLGMQFHQWLLLYPNTRELRYQTGEYADGYAEYIAVKGKPVNTYLGRLESDSREWAGLGYYALKALVIQCIAPFMVGAGRFTVDETAWRDENSVSWRVSEILGELGHEFDYEGWPAFGTPWPNRPDMRCCTLSKQYRRIIAMTAAERGKEGYAQPEDVQGGFVIPVEELAGMPEPPVSEPAGWLAAGHDVQFGAHGGKWRGMNATSILAEARKIRLGVQQ